MNDTSVIRQAAQGFYDSKLSCGWNGSTERRLFMEDKIRLQKQFHEDLKQEQGTCVLPATIEQAFFDKIWNSVVNFVNYDGDLTEIAAQYERFAPIVLAAFEAGIKTRT